MEVVDEYEDDSSSSPSITASPTTDPVELERQRMLQTVQRTTTQILSGANNSNNNTTNTSNHPSHGNPDGGGPATRGIARKASLQRGGGGGGGEEMVKTVGGGRGPPGRTNSSLLRSGGGGGGATTGMMAVRTLAAPTRDTDCLSSMRGNSVQRANSSLRLQRSISSRAAPAGRGLVAAVPRTHSMQVGGGGLVPPRRAPPSRTCSVDSTNSLRAYRRDQLANVRIESSRGGGGGGGARMMGPGATLERNTSDASLITAGDLSCFTMDSVNLRKTQLVADPLEDATYHDVDSYADHESVSRASQFSEYPILRNGTTNQAAAAAAAAAAPPRMGVSRTPSRMGAIKVDKNSGDQHRHRRHHDNSNSHNNDDDDDDDDDDDSFGTMTSGLTTDFTEHEELMHSDDEEEEEGNNHHRHQSPSNRYHQRHTIQDDDDDDDDDDHDMCEG